VSPLVTEFERVNAFFQATNANPEEMMGELDTLIPILNIFSLLWFLLIFGFLLAE
jgi:hypothetical protein